MENKLIDDIAAEICAGIDEGEPCVNLCHVCLRQAEAAMKIAQSAEAHLRARIWKLERSLLEVMEVAVQHEEGEYIKRAQDLLFNAEPHLKLVKDADSV